MHVKSGSKFVRYSSIWMTTIFECLTKPMVSRIPLSLDELLAWSTQHDMWVNRTKTKGIITIDFSVGNSFAETIH